MGKRIWQVLAFVGLVATGSLFGCNSQPMQSGPSPPSAQDTGLQLLASMVDLHSPSPQSGALFGSSVAAADVNGDGNRDVIVGAPASAVGSLDNAGEVFVFLGPDLKNYTSLRAISPEDSALFGASVGAGDVNGDGQADVLIGAPGSTVEGLASAGEVFVFLGPDLGTQFSLLDPSPEAGAYFGVSVAAADVDGDGRADVIVGAHMSDVAGEADAGEAFVFSAAAQQGAVTLSEGTPQGGAEFGFSVAAGDVDGDGNADVIVGAPDSDLGGAIDAGEAFVFVGTPVSNVLELRDPTPETTAEFGRSVVAARLRGDGRAAVIVGAKGSDVNGNEGAGEVFAFLGEEAITLHDPNPEIAAWFGFCVAAGDVNGDGLDDVIVGSSDSDVGDVGNAGQVFIFLSPELTEAITLEDPTPQDRGHFGVSVAAGDVTGDGAADVIAGAHFADLPERENAGEIIVFLTEKPRAEGDRTR